jgi:hypothetical protein
LDGRQDPVADAYIADAAGTPHIRGTVAGGAAVFFNKSESKVEVLNDAHGDLVNLYRVLKHHLEEFSRQFKWALTGCSKATGSRK